MMGSNIADELCTLNIYCSESKILLIVFDVFHKLTFILIDRPLSVFCYF